MGFQCGFSDGDEIYKSTDRNVLYKLRDGPIWRAVPYFAHDKHTRPKAPAHAQVPRVLVLLHRKCSHSPSAA